MPRGLGNFSSREGSRKVWAKYFGSLKTYRNGCFAGNWTFPEGSLERYKAKVVVLIVGGRNLLIEHQSPESVARGIASCVDQIHQRSPQAKILLVGIPLPVVGKSAPLPFGANSEFAEDQVAKTKDLVAKLADGKRVQYVDPRPNLLARKKEIEEGLAKETDVHEVTAIWEAIAESIAEPLQAMLKAEPAK